MRALKLAPETVQALALSDLVHIESAKLGVTTEELRAWRPAPVVEAREEVEGAPTQRAPVTLDWQIALLAVHDGQSLCRQLGRVITALPRLLEQGLVRTESRPSGGVWVHLTPAGHTLAASLGGAR